MATKSMSYDHPAYLAVLQQPALSVAGTGITGSATNTQKYGAFTALLVKSVTSFATVLSTSADNALLFRITNNGTNAVNTVTCTYTLNTGVLGSAAYFGNATLNTASAVGTSAATTQTLTIGGSPVLQQGDQWYVQKGTDATTTVGYMVELAILPLANVSV